MTTYRYKDLVAGIYIETDKPKADPWRYILLNGSADEAGHDDEDLLDDDVEIAFDADPDLDDFLNRHQTDEDAS